MAIILDVSGQACPIPLVKARRAMDKMQAGEILEVIVTDDDSKVNITMAAKELNMDLKRITQDNTGRWHITIRKKP